MKIKAINNFHNTESFLFTKKDSKGEYVTPLQIQKCLDRLCCKDCSCNRSDINLDKVLVIDANSLFYSDKKRERLYLKDYS